jgi:hypothetical protein
MGILDEAQREPVALRRNALSERAHGELNCTQERARESFYTASPAVPTVCVACKIRYKIELFLMFLKLESFRAG